MKKKIRALLILSVTLVLIVMIMRPASAFVTMSVMVVLITLITVIGNAPNILPKVIARLMRNLDRFLLP